MSASDGDRYFAYGSNLYLPRMQRRVPSALPLTVAQLPGYRLTFGKRSRDGSAKCTIEPAEAPEETVWGVIYRIDPGERPRLDEAEGPRYELIDLEVVTPDEERVAVFTYRARPEYLGHAWPYDWYRDLVLEGARQHALPAEYITRIAAVTGVPDPDPVRARANRPRPW